jgi:chemotaxis-related protein WspB
MLFLLCRLGSERYALSTQQIVEVLPLVEWKTIPYATTGILGVFNYHGQIVPLLDLTMFVAQQPSRMLMSTRIILISLTERSADSDEEAQLIGLVAEEVTRTINASPSDFTEAGVDAHESPYLGPVLSDSEGIIQFIEVLDLLPDRVRDQLFQSIANFE